MFSKCYKFSKLVMYLNSCSMDLGRDSVGIKIGPINRVAQRHYPTKWALTRTLEI